MHFTGWSMAVQNELLTTKNKLTLPVVLERIRQKRALNLPLTENELALLSNLRDRTLLAQKEEFVADSDKLHLVRSVNAEPVIDAVKVMSEIQAEGKTSSWRRYFGTIDPITAALFAKESRTKIGTREFAAYVKRRLNDDYTRFRA